MEPQMSVKRMCTDKVPPPRKAVLDTQPLIFSQVVSYFKPVTNSPFPNADPIPLREFSLFSITLK